MKKRPHDYLGVHVSIGGGVELAPLRGRLLECSAIQIFTKSARQWKDKPITEAQAAAFKKNMKECEIDAVVAHNTYLINLATNDPVFLEKSIAAMIDEIERCELLGVPGVVAHPGSHVGQGEDAGLAAITKNLNVVLEATNGYRTKVLLENVAGQGSNLGFTFEQLARLRNDSLAPSRIGFCFDTCHALASGYDIARPGGWAETMEQWDALIGIEHIAAFHLNDSKKGCGSRVDRHEHIGMGCVGLGCFHALVNDARFAKVPKMLETDKEHDAFEDRENLKVLRELVGKKRVPKAPMWQRPEEVDEEWVKRLKCC